MRRSDCASKLISSFTLCLLILFSISSSFHHMSVTVSVSAQAIACPGTATQYYTVFVQPTIIALSKVDGVEQQFYIDFYLNSFWADLSQNNPCTAIYRPGSDWSPTLELINVVEMTKGTFDGSKTAYGVVPSFINNATGTLPTFFNTWGAGSTWAVDNNRFAGTFSSSIQMQSFPYDNQVLQVYIESAITDVTGMSFQFWADNTSLANIQSSIQPNVQIDGWTIDLPGVQFYTVEQGYPSYLAGQSVQYFSRFVMSIPIKRIPDFFVMKICVPTILLVIMANCLFVLQVKETDRVMGTFTVFCGLITVLFVAAQFTPVVPYQTRLDIFLLFSFFTITLMMLTRGVLYYWREDDSTIIHAPPIHVEVGDEDGDDHDIVNDAAMGTLVKSGVGIATAPIDTHGIYGPMTSPLAPTVSSHPVLSSSSDSPPSKYRIAGSGPDAAGDDFPTRPSHPIPLAPGSTNVSDTLPTPMTNQQRVNLAFAAQAFRGTSASVKPLPPINRSTAGSDDENGDVLPGTAVTITHDASSSLSSGHGETNHTNHSHGNPTSPTITAATTSNNPQIEMQPGINSTATSPTPSLRVMRGMLNAHNSIIRKRRSMVRIYSQSGDPNSAETATSATDTQPRPVSRRLGVDTSGKGCWDFIKKWFLSLVFTRKIDAILAPFFFVWYTVGVAIIMRAPGV